MKKNIPLNDPAEETKSMLIKNWSGGHSSITVTQSTYELLHKYESLDPQIKQVLDELVSVKLKLDTVSLLINLAHEKLKK